MIAWSPKWLEESPIPIVYSPLHAYDSKLQITNNSFLFVHNYSVVKFVIALKLPSNWLYFVLIFSATITDSL